MSNANTITTKVKSDIHKDVKVFCAQYDLNIAEFYSESAKERMSILRNLFKATTPTVKNKKK